MTDFDKALAAAREALAYHYKHAEFSDTPVHALDAIGALDDLLDALDAARGEARQKVKDTLTDYLDHYPHLELLDAVMAHFVTAAQPAALDAAALAKRLDKILGCHADSMPKEAYFEVDAVMRALLQAQPAAAYNEKQIAWELERTALGDGFYGNALRVAKDLPGVTADDRALLDKFATGNARSTDHVRLQELALRLYPAPPAAVPAGWRVVWFTGSFRRGSERWEIYDPEGNGGAVDKGDIRDDMVWGLLDALAADNKENKND